MAWRGEIADTAGRAARVLPPVAGRMVAGVRRPGFLSALLRGVVLCGTVLLISGADAGLQAELRCLAQNIYFEARLEPEEGRRAVAHVVMNRVADRRWPESACAVIRQGWPEDGPLCQFSWHCDERADEPRPDAYWDEARRLARRVYFGWSGDPSGGALWYHADYVEPWWGAKLRRGRKIGRHIFYHDPAPPVAGNL